MTDRYENIRKALASIKTLARYEPDTVYIGTGEYVAECVRADDGDYYLAADVDAAIDAAIDAAQQPAPPSAPVGAEGHAKWIEAVTRELAALGFSPEAAQLFASIEAAEYERGECDCAEHDPKDMLDLLMGTASHIVKKWERESVDRLHGYRPAPEDEGRAITAVEVMLFGRACYLPADIAQEVEQACAAHATTPKEQQP